MKSAIEDTFTFDTINKVRHQLLIQRRLIVYPRLVPFVRFVFERLGFHIKLDAVLYLGAIGDCPVALGVRYGRCDDHGTDEEINQADCC